MTECSDPRAYLETEARIIAEDETYAVIALRVEKALLSRNLLLLAALADLMPRNPVGVLPKAAGAA